MTETAPPPSAEAPGARTPATAHDGASNPWAMRTIRYFLPAAVILAGILVMSFGSETDLEGGGGIVSAGLAIYLINWLFRAGTSGDREREAEDAARDYFDVHGRWPD
jgi:hypothetical protein